MVADREPQAVRYNGGPVYLLSLCTAILGTVLLLFSLVNIVILVMLFLLDKYTTNKQRFIFLCL